MATIKKVDLTAVTQEDVNEWLKKFDDNELAMITVAIKHETIDRAERRIAAARADVAAALERQGMTLEQVFGKAGKANGGSVAPKFRNPNDPSQTWTGRGKRPNWLTAIIKNMSPEEIGHYLASIEI